MLVHSEKEAHVVRLTQQLELLVAHPERVGQIVRTPETNNKKKFYLSDCVLLKSTHTPTLNIPLQ